MQSSILLVLWAAIAIFIYRFAQYVLVELRHSRNAKRLGCVDPPRFVNYDYLGLYTVYKSLQADGKRDLMGLIQEFWQNVRKRESEIKNQNLLTVRQTLLGGRSVVTIEPKNIQAILATQFKDFGLGERRNGNFEPLLGRGIFSSDGERWSHARALLRPQFVRDQVSDLELEEQHMQNLMRMLPVGKDRWTSVINIQPLFFKLTIDSATEFLFGESVDSQLADLPGYTYQNPIAKDFPFHFDRAQTAIAQGIRLQDMYKLAHTKQMKDDCRVCHNFIDHYVRKALSKSKTSSQVTSSGKQRYVLLDALAESTSDPLELRYHMLSILLAGRDTTASTISFAFMYLAQRPDIYARLRAIILDTFGSRSHPRSITFEGLKNCNYLQWVLNETLRLQPVVPIDWRQALVDTTLPTGGGPDGTSPIYIRKGDNVDYQIYIMQRRTDLWGADAEVFRPERWEGRKFGWEFLPFNGGPRICVGQQFALTEAAYVIVRLLQRFERMEGVGNSWEPVEKGGEGFVRTTVTLTMAPADGVKVRFMEAAE
ncbi:hypothetical protein N0V90_010100 [Kalmusia sp. IMI 367209]|nr:hypothetical protein N0V90_010100 [Kalmusia sp. IMI 367209]